MVDLTSDTYRNVIFLVLAVLLMAASGMIRLVLKR